MHRTGEARRITALLSQTEELAELGRTAQDEDGSLAEPAVRQLQTRYPAWYAAGLAVLPEDLRDRFVEQYEAKHPTLSPRIKQFIAHPRQPWALYNSVPRFLKGHGRWQHSLKQSYEEPLLEQRRLLLEASSPCWSLTAWRTPRFHAGRIDRSMDGGNDALTNAESHHSSAGRFHGPRDFVCG
ncbi:hypothetical protein GCM10009555_065830 [Acrocarpospora macrocephala]|uniref:Uncharacterized protein n=1 Tax=Acrocarpospora macrocephala TaxID=150177 RepID=A0A5M3X3M4_9ACTN|nr:hypothetical protein [Acrocarpospora macrocephala]GES13433.1 hypothetical protein Amac_070300 [Acrocarpospora macrocephala]